MASTLARGLSRRSSAARATMAGSSRSVWRSACSQAPGSAGCGAGWRAMRTATSRRMARRPCGGKGGVCQCSTVWPSGSVCCAMGQLLTTSTSVWLAVRETGP